MILCGICRGVEIKFSEMDAESAKEVCDKVGYCDPEFVENKCTDKEPEIFPCKYSGMVSQFCVDSNCNEVNGTCDYLCPRRWQEKWQSNCLANPSADKVGPTNNRGRAGLNVAVPNSLPWQVAVVTKVL